MNSKRGQVWSMDYTLGMLLFILTLLLATSVLVRSVFTDDGFEELHASAEAISAQLMGKGYPLDWRSEDVISAGLLTDEQLSLKKVERLFSIAEVDYERSKALLNTQFEYAISFYEPNGDVFPILTGCKIGSSDMTEQKTVAEEQQKIGYYGGASEDLKPTVESLNGTVYTNILTFFDNLEEINLAIFEHPQFSTISPPYDGQKRTALENFVSSGGTLFLIGNVSLPELFSINLTLANSSDDASGTSFEDALLNLSGLTIETFGAETYVHSENGQNRYANISKLPDGRDIAARFTYGDGDVAYLGGLSGTINETGQPLLNLIAQGLYDSTKIQVANCTTITPAEADNYVSVKRLVAYDGRVLVMRVDVWKL